MLKLYHGSNVVIDNYEDVVYVFSCLENEIETGVVC